MEQDNGPRPASLDGYEDGLASIEKLPLAERAAAYAEVQARLRSRLEDADGRG
ncbi:MULTISPECIES: hypothetical protein [unclassified Rathayibacter]|uniref:hypothetical protein n=1 Tax=unclassified Rathayibacter TaxID=2609250 RepID=UPI00188A2282|nr:MULTISPECIES: hypothetical protein [unclassified Rathayibacter]MBF4462661.1 hypothetical protein [Rathayibacter sp. VKM Ac-2879]MBF4503296.1 hypothetical protein [Rathayibacter sp. VKM Ac-2878]